MKSVPSLILLCTLASCLWSSGCTGPQAPAVPAQPAVPDQAASMAGTARTLSASINTGLSDISTGLRNNSRFLSGMNLSGPVAEDVLSDNYLRFPWTLSSVIISPDGIILSAVPTNYAGIVGENVSSHGFFRAATAAKAPRVSTLFRMVEGFDAIAQSSPVFSASGVYLGYTDITYEPAVFLERHAAAATAGTPYEVWIAQADGTILYDVHKEEIGSNILTGPEYVDPGLQETLTRIAREPSGSGTYRFYDDNWNGTVAKTAVWETAGIDGAEWRVVITASENDTAAPVVTGQAAAGGPAAARYENLTRFVGRAAAYAKEHGKEAALREFNDINGSFIEGELYIFAYESGGTVIALPFQQGLLGTDRSGITDPNGVQFIRGLADAARNGGGSFYYIYPNPADNYRNEFKLSYVLPVDDTWFVGSGIYLPGLPASFNTTERDLLVERVKVAQRHAQAGDAGKAIADFNDRNGTFADGSRYIYAYGYNGTTLALPFQSGYIGTNRLDYTDPYGVKILQLEVALAKRGGGFLYVEYLNPETGVPGLKLIYVAPIDNEWFVGSGIYTTGL